MRKLFLSICMASSVLCWADDVRVSSPDGNLVVTVSDAGGRLYYSVKLDGQQVLEPSALGLKTSFGDITKDLSIVDSQISTVDTVYQMRGTKASTATYQANALKFKVESKEGLKFKMEFQVSNNDIAHHHRRHHRR